MNTTEAPVWVKYAGDIFYILLFLVVLFFVKSDTKEEDTLEEDQTESPNALESLLVSDEEPEEIEVLVDEKPEKKG